MINNYLFPDLSEPTDTEISSPQIPIMHEETREELYHILVLLCKQVDHFAKVVDLVSDIIPHGTLFDIFSKSLHGYSADEKLSQTTHTTPTQKASLSKCLHSQAMTQMKAQSLPQRTPQTSRIAISSSKTSSLQLHLHSFAFGTNITRSTVHRHFQIPVAHGEK